MKVILYLHVRLILPYRLYTILEQMVAASHLELSWPLEPTQIAAKLLDSADAANGDEVRGKGAWVGGERRIRAWSYRWSRMSIIV